MKFPFIILIVITLLVNCTEKPSDNVKVYTRQELFDKIKNEASKIVTQYSYDIKFGEPEKSPSSKSINYFKNDSILILRIDRSDLGDYTYIYERGRKNELLKIKGFSNNKIVSESIYEYDKNGNQIKVTSYNSKGDIKYRSLFKYDALNNVTEEFYYDSTSLRSKTESKYDLKGREIEKITRDFYDSNGHRIVSKFRYDIKNNLISEFSQTFIEYNLKWKFFQDMLIQYSYDKDGRLIQKTKKSPYTRNNNQPFYDRREESKYDDNGNLIELARYTITKENGETLEDKWTRKYNSNGNLIEHTYYNNLGEITSFSKYEYEFLQSKI